MAKEKDNLLSIDDFNINKVMDKVKEMRNGFTLESDFQFVVGRAILDLYNVDVIMEYNPNQENIDIENESKEDNEGNKDKKREYIDIMVIGNDQFIPIELKYKHSQCKVKIKEEEKDTGYYKLTNQSCQTYHREKYAEDIERIHKIKEESKIINNPITGKKMRFKVGYAIFLTNFHHFKNKSKNYKKYLLYEDENKKEQPFNVRITEIEGLTDYKMQWYKDKEKFKYIEIKKGKEEDNSFEYVITTIK